MTDLSVVSIRQDTGLGENFRDELFRPVDAFLGRIRPYRVGRRSSSPEESPEFGRALRARRI